ncbi:hypothetical protein [Sphingomonas immobilis]|uniref:Rz protein n=1 Tax=Sphingomonas immobilis TaxID=3063997 RepID=A0ABT9A3A5_9SPHN|nr:hypothetical protein [Sphingomonas sp. CA1-15]MDO7843471.1 hypothetical protein [Sphingomonas sp. CA1-15]
MGGFVLKDFLTKWWPVLAGGAIVAVLLTLAFCSGQQAGTSGAVVKEQGRTIETQRQVGDANTNASAARVGDAVKTEQQKQELHDAVENATDPDDARRRLGCAVMRQQGRDTAGISACR